jgi:hypothetical protein
MVYDVSFSDGRSEKSNEAGRRFNPVEVRVPIASAEGFFPPHLKYLTLHLLFLSIHQ